MSHGFIFWIIVGGIAGFLASHLVKGKGLGLFGDIIVGIIGAFIGGWIFSVLGITVLGWIGSIIAAFVGAVVLLVIIRMFKRS